MDAEGGTTSLVRTMFLPPERDEWVSEEKLRLHYVYRLVLVATFLNTNFLIWLFFRNADFVVEETLRIFLFTNLAPMAFDLAISAAVLRRWSRLYAPTILLCTMLEMFSAVVWTQMTGTTSSYFLAVLLACPLLYRLVYNYWVFLVAICSVLGLLLLAYVLEIRGVIPYASLFKDVHEAYLAAQYRQIVLVSLASALFVGFAGMNVMAARFKRSQAELANVQSRLRRAEKLQAGRLSGTRVGNYELRDVLGRGGMGEVYAGRHISTNREVAVKVLHAHLGELPEMRSRLRREFDVVQRMPATSVAAIVEHGSTIDGYDFVVMERLRGEDLGGLLTRRGRLSLDEALPILHGIAVALEAAHALGVVHRDLKPPNVFICNGTRPDGGPDVRLLDFGVARFTEQGSTQLTATAAVLGTPGYISPEQATGGPISPAIDVFALACIAYRMLTGDPAFTARQPAAALRQVLVYQPIPPSRMVTGLPRAVDNVINVALAVDPRRRHALASAFVAELEAVRLGEDITDLEARADAALRPAAEGFERTLTQMEDDPARPAEGGTS